MARVLVIDDDEAQRTLMRAMLTGVGHEVVEASDGAEGIELVATHAPNLVLTDINMPGVDGHEVIASLKVASPNMPIIAVSGGSEIAKDELLLKAAQLGAIEVIMKPFAFEQLAGAVHRAIKG